MSADGNAFKTVYLCDICNDPNLTFSSFEAAIAHEEKCQGPSEPIDVPQAPDVKAASSKSFKFFKCKKCKLLFRHAQSAARHELKCMDIGWESCSVCNVMRFRTDTARMQHEASCGGDNGYRAKDLPLAAESDDEPTAVKKSESEVIDLQSSEDEPDVEESVEPVAAEQANQAVDKKESTDGNTNPSEEARESHGYEEQSLQNPSGTHEGEKAAEQSDKSGGGNEGNNNNDQNNNGKEDKGRTKEGYTTVWSCDFCTKFKSEEFDDAFAHEKICPENPDNKPKGDATNNLNAAVGGSNPGVSSSCSNLPTSPPKVGPNSKKVTLLSPVVSATDKANSTNLSSHFFTILSSLDLLYHPYSTQISFNCHYCNSQLPTSGMKWNLSRIVQVLPNVTTKHLLGDEQVTGCALVPDEISEQLRSVDNVESSMVRTFEAFILSYFVERDIIPRNSDGRFVYGPAQRADGKHSPGNLGKKRRASDKQNESPSKKPKERDVFPPWSKVKIGDMGATIHTSDEGNNQFYLAPSAPLDGVPLVSSITSEESKKLPIPLQILLQQVEFFNLSSVKLSPIDEAPLPNAVGLRCQNCVSDPNGCGFIPLTSVKNLAAHLRTFSTDHLVFCKCTETSDRGKLKEYAFDNSDGLARYCMLIVKLYGLEDSSNDGLHAVVYGDCPPIPSGYIGSPKNINVDFALDLNTSTDATTNQQSNDELRATVSIQQSKE